MTSTAPVPPPYRFTTWTFKQNLARALWLSAARPLWVFLPFYRPALLRLFGAKVGAGCRFSGTSRVEIPWNLTIGSDVRVGDRCILLSLGLIRIGDRCVLDYGAHVCAGTHDMTDPTFPLVRTPIVIGADCFLGMQSFIGPGVTIGDGCRVLPRACVYRDAAAGSVLHGNPARLVTTDLDASTS